MQDEVCVPVLKTYPLTVTKKVDNKASVSLSGLTFPVTVNCSLPNPDPSSSTPIYSTSTSWNLADGGTQTVFDIPAGATCTASEAWETMATPVESKCKPPSVLGWTQPNYSPPSLVIGPPSNVITVTNTIDCVTGRTPAILKVCKVAGLGIAIGTPFTFTAGSGTFTVPAGPGPGGTCVLAASFPVGSTVTVSEAILAGNIVSGIAVAPAGRLVGPNLAAGSVSVTLGSGVTEVTFTDKRTGFLEICKKGDVKGNFTFTVDPGALGPFVVPAGACSPAIEVAAGPVTVHEMPAAGSSMSGCATMPAVQQGACDLATQTSTVNVVPGDVSAMTIALITNASAQQTNSLTLKKTVSAATGASAPDLTGVQFPVDVVCTPPGPSTSVILTAPTLAQVIPNIPVGSTCNVVEQPLTSTGTCGKPLVSVAIPPPTYVPGQTVTITAPPSTPTVTVNNVMACVSVGSLRVEKKMAPKPGVNPIPPGITFPVQVACPPLPIQTVNLTAATPSVTLPNIVAGIVCTLTELPPVGPIPANCQWGPVIYPIGQTATIPAQSTIERFVQNNLVCTSPTAVIDKLPMQGGNEKTPCPKLGAVLTRADAPSVPYLGIVLPGLDLQCAAKGSGFKAQSTTFLTCAPDPRGVGFGPNATANLTCGP
jgi:uncharacterized membrane protein